MKHISALFLSLAVFVTLLSSCGGKKDGVGDLPSNFDKIGDSGRVKVLMTRVSPDSLAHMIIDGALKREGSIRIDTLAVATNYAYDHLRTPEDIDTFGVAYDSYIASLPLGEKMKVYMLGGSEDPQRLGYRLGLDYMTTIRDGNMTVEQVDKELQEFKRTCGNDTAMYQRFMTGFKTVLELDHGKDVPEAIYNKYAK